MPRGHTQPKIHRSVLLLAAIFGLVLVTYFVFISSPSSSTELIQELSDIAHIQPFSASQCAGIVSEEECRERAAEGCKPLVANVCDSSHSMYLGCYSPDVVPSESKRSCAKQPNRMNVWFEDFELRHLPPYWQPDPGCSECFSHRPSLSLITLIWTEKDSMLNSLKSWKKGGLLDFTDENIVYIQERNPEKEKLFDGYSMKIIGTQENTNIAYALDQMVKHATSDYVLFMEKDWELVEPFPVVKQQLEIGLELIEKGKADQVKYRSRYNGGFPNFAQMFYQGVEDTVYQQQPNLMCNFFHWIDDPDLKWPDKFRKCHSDPNFYCIDSYYCNWTNNPILFKREWWLKNFSKFAMSLNQGHKHNWEGTMNSDPSLWNGRNFVIAQGNGLFTHHEINEDE